jgi:HK97 family phage prohead protease
MVGFLKKNITGQALDIDTKSRSVKVAIASVENLDRDGDVIAKGAFNRTVSQRGPKGSNEIWHLIDHRASITSALGKFSDLFVEGNYLVGLSEYKDSYLWREVVWPLYEKGDINQHSIGFSIVKEDKLKDGTNRIEEVMLYEGSAVLWGANPETPTLEVAKSIGIYNEDDDVIAKMDKLIKRLKGDQFTEDDRQLFMIELKQLQQEFIDAQKKETTLTDEESTGSVNVLDLKAIAIALSL